MAKLRVDLPRIFEKLVRNREHFVVEKANIPVGVIVNYDEYRQMLDELEDLKLACNPDVLDDIKKARQESREGTTVSYEQLRKELGL